MGKDPELPRHKIADTPPLDAWDLRTRGLSLDSADERPRLAQLARRFLEERGDQALGLAPARLLPPRKARAWILFWCAARRVDDSVEAGAANVAAWRNALQTGGIATFAERCLHAFMKRPEGAGTAFDLPQLFGDGLAGLEQEERFTEPQPLSAYLDLIAHKSFPAMLILDRLLFPGETAKLHRRHAALFAASTQIGDDCRDARRDLARRRCFVTQEELGAVPRAARSPDRYVSSPRFSKGRSRLSLWLLHASNRVAADFVLEANRRTARSLSGWWQFAIRSNQIRPTKSRLKIPVASNGGKAWRDASTRINPPSAPLVRILRRHFGLRRGAWERSAAAGI